MWMGPTVLSFLLITQAVAQSLPEPDPLDVKRAGLQALDSTQLKDWTKVKCCKLVPWLDPELGNAGCLCRKWATYKTTMTCSLNHVEPPAERFHSVRHARSLSATTMRQKKSSDEAKEELNRCATTHFKRLYAHTTSGSATTTTQTKSTTQCARQLVRHWRANARFLWPTSRAGGGTTSAAPMLIEWS